MTFQEFCLLIASTLASVMGQLFLKIGALKLGKVTSGNITSHVVNMVTTPEVLVGLAAYGVGAIAYILLLTRVNLSVAGPSAAIIYVFSVLLGYFFFKEAIPVSRLVGLGFITCGVILVVWKSK